MEICSTFAEQVLKRCQADVFLKPSKPPHTLWTPILVQNPDSSTWSTCPQGRVTPTGYIIKTSQNRLWIRTCCGPGPDLDQNLPGEEKQYFELPNGQKGRWAIPQQRRHFSNCILVDLLTQIIDWPKLSLSPLSLFNSLFFPSTVTPFFSPSFLVPPSTCLQFFSCKCLYP